ncbi:MAG: 5-formyltetrahydrofolate cyclo-ligase [Oscillospiraceae bacterium]|nr:5-formyltetrahydrofolate cyclo-ligase [Oscillospiraceae bacterium]
MNPDFFKNFPEKFPGTIPEQKKALRQYMRHVIRNYQNSSPDVLKKADSVIFEKLCEDPGIHQAEFILCYYGMPGEPATYDFMMQMLRQGKKVALPKCDPQQPGRMDFYEIRNLSEQEIQPGLYGIPEPIRKIPVNFNNIHNFNKMIMIVPGLAFTPSGDRLGRGGGYYDRFLQDHPMLEKIGLCYDCMIVPEIPREKHDAYSHVNRLITG